MKFDIWIIDAGFKLGADQVSDLLDGQLVAIVSPQELELFDGESDCPAELVAVTDSWRTTSEQHLRRAVHLASLLPVIVIDKSFNTKVAQQLAVQHVQDYFGFEG